MNLKINHKLIKEMCGTVSFKRGDSFYRAKKVRVSQYSAKRCEAIVKGTEDFYVVIEKDSNHGIQATCSCPKLASFQKDCQHIAAVLLVINEHQQSGLDPMIQLPNTSIPSSLPVGLLTMFTNQPARPSSYQRHFDNRRVLDIIFTCKPFILNKGGYMLGIELQIDGTPVKDIRDFLKKVSASQTCLLTPLFSYDPNLHCFQKESDNVLQVLFQMILDERVFFDDQHGETTIENSNNQLLIPPSSIERLLPLLIKAPMVLLDYNGKTFDGLRISDELLPIQFELKENGVNSLRLMIEGLDDIIVFDLYSFILYDGKFIQLLREDYERLSYLIGLLNGSAQNYIPIPQEQINFFIEKVVPGLKKLGTIILSKDISKRLQKTPLIAKLYLDRVKNRLLAGLDFHYENEVINPLEGRENGTSTLMTRDKVREDEILELIEGSSFIKTEGGYYLHNEQLEYEFLYHTVPKLQKLVQIYATTAVRNRIFRENAKPQIRVSIKRERTNWLDFKFDMAGITDDQIKGLLVALEEKRKYYRLRDGSLLSLETREFAEIQRFLLALPVQKDDIEARLNAPILKGIQLLEYIDEGQTFTHEDSFRQFLDNIRNPANLAFEVPIVVTNILRDYQIVGYKWMKSLAHYGFGGILADDMGLGKTLQAITFILSELQNARKRKLPILVVCPASVTYNWLHEFMKFASTIEVIVLDGSRKERVQIQEEIKDMDVIITSYPLLRQDIEWFETQSFHTVFFDEAQVFKNPVTQTARAVKKIQAEYRFALTGTPVENSLEELWSIFHVVFPDLFKGLKEYSNLTRKTIAKRIRPFLLRRLKEDVLEELPHKLESIEALELLPEQKKLYAAYLAKLRHDTLKHLDKETLRKNRMKILAGLTRLRQICCHPALFVDGYKGSSAKFEQLLQIIEESRLAGRRVLIFSQFTKMLGIIGRELTNLGQPYFYLDGKTPSAERIEKCNQFNAGERDFFLISLKAGGNGLNLTGADTVILYDIWWNPAVEEQAADRAHRMGQTNIVHVIKLVARGTIEDKMNELQAKKKQLIEEIIEFNEKANYSLSDEDIRELLMI